MGKRKITIVEDDNLSFLILKNMLLKLGYEIADFVTEGEKAILSCSENRPDLVLMDIGLSGAMDGIEAAQIIKEKFDIPVVYVTSSLDDETLQRAKITDPSGYIIKPIIERDLRTTIEMALYKHKLEKKIKNNADWLKITLESIADAVMTIDNYGIVTFINPVAKSLIASPGQSVLGKSFLEIFTIVDDNNNNFFELPFIKIKEAEGIKEPPKKANLITEKGTKIPIEFKASPIVDEFRNLSGIVLVFRDITERKLIEEEMKKALEKERELGELKSAFISMVSHEFRTPMTSILASTEFLEKYSDNIDAEKKKKNFQRIQNNIKQMTQLLNDVLIIGKSEAGKLEFFPEPVNLNSFCSSLVEQFEFDNPEKTKNRINFTMQEFKIKVMLDEKLVKQMLENLLSNAIKYSDKSSVVIFEVAEIEGNIRFTVSDQGIGIPEDDQLRLFETFQRAKNVGNISGTGLGLSIVKRAVDLHKGTINVKSETGKGSAFVIRLPLIFCEEE